jgi:phasin family protein
VHYNTIAFAEGLFEAQGPGRILTLKRRAAAVCREDLMNTDQMQKMSKDSMDMAMASFGTWTKNAQAIATEVADYSKKSFEGSAAAWEKLMGAKSLEKAMEVQSEYLKSSYEDFVAQSTKLGELYTGLAKEAYKPFEGVMAKAGMK